MSLREVSVFGVFLVRIFPYSDWIRRDTPYLSLFSPNAGKYGPEKLWIRTLFTQCVFVKNSNNIDVWQTSQYVSQNYLFYKIVGSVIFEVTGYKIKAITNFIVNISPRVSLVQNWCYKRVSLLSKIKQTTNKAFVGHPHDWIFQKYYFSVFSNTISDSLVKDYY